MSEVDDFDLELELATAKPPTTHHPQVVVNPDTSTERQDSPQDIVTPVQTGTHVEAENQNIVAEASQVAGEEDNSWSVDA